MSGLCTVTPASRQVSCEGHVLPGGAPLHPGRRLHDAHVPASRPQQHPRTANAPLSVPFPTHQRDWLPPLRVSAVAARRRILGEKSREKISSEITDPEISFVGHDGSWESVAPTRKFLRIRDLPRNFSPDSSSRTKRYTRDHLFFMPASAKRQRDELTLVFLGR